MSGLELDSPLQFVKGVGPGRATALAELGLKTVGDLLTFFPFRHEIEHGLCEIADVLPGMTATVQGEVRRISGRFSSFSVRIHDGTGGCTLRWFQRGPGGMGIYPGATVIATGKARAYNNELELIQPRVRVRTPGDREPPQHVAPRQVGIYHATQRIRATTIRQLVESLLEQDIAIADLVPAALRAANDLLQRGLAIRQMHQPDNEAQLERARRTLAYEEFLLLELAMALRRRRVVTMQRGRVLKVTPAIDARIRQRFPFALTAAQDRVIAPICADLASGYPMTRLVQGDVGSGKTVVALYACLVAVANRRQAAIMAPTELLARQHFQNIERYLDGSRVRRVLLTGGLSKRQRSDTLAAIEAGEIDLVVGTQALLQHDVAFRDLALVVVDEQHKFGVMQRATFRTKGPMPHYLVMTATPIPRTLAMTVFGDLDVSTIDAAPPGRGSIQTRLISGPQWAGVMSRLRSRLEAGEQAYVVCPLIGLEDETSQQPPPPREPGAPPLVSAIEAHKQLTTGPWRGLNVGLLHGGLPGEEKQRVLGEFAAGRLHALVSTTVVEVGVDVPNASIMVIENADRFGLSQLHQLRGRVGRGARDSLCLLIARSRGASARDRLRVLTETTDGFRIAEADLQQRGPGEFLGTRQHGLPELRVGNLVTDFALLEQARADAKTLLAADPQLERPEHRALLPAIRKLYGKKLQLIDAA